jgi:hypothetical protein
MGRFSVARLPSERRDKGESKGCEKDNSGYTTIPRPHSRNMRVGGHARVELAQLKFAFRLVM